MVLTVDRMVLRPGETQHLATPLRAAAFGHPVPPWEVLFLYKSLNSETAYPVKDERPLITNHAVAQSRLVCYDSDNGQSVKTNDKMAHKHFSVVLPEPSCFFLLF